MARSRNIKPGFYKNEDLAECSIWARFIFPGLWMLADREGRLEDRPKRIKAELLPFDSQETEPLLRELDQREFILRYQVDGISYIQITAFLRHQSPHHREQGSVIPAPPGWVSPGHEANDSTVNPEASASIQEGRAPNMPEALESRNDVARGQSRADSLIPDSLIRIPDSPKAPKAAFDLPDWVPKGPWDAFIEMRCHKRLKPTAEAQRLICTELERLRTSGEDISEVLNQSARNSWTDLYPVKNKSAATSTESASPWWKSENGIRAQGKRYQMAPDSEKPFVYFSDAVKAEARRRGELVSGD